MYHLKRKHKIVCDTIDQYMAQGLVVFRGGQGAGGQQVANPEWRFFISRNFFPNIFRILLDFPGFFPGFWQLLFWAARIWTNKKFATNFFQSKNHKKQKQYYYYAITYLPIANCSKNLDEERKKKLFWFFRDAESNILICNIHLVSDCTVLHKIKRRKIVQTLSPRIFLSTVDKIIGTKYICTKYVDRNYNIHLQNTTTLLPIIQELFFHVIIFFCPAQIKNIYCFSQKKYQLKKCF